MWADEADAPAVRAAHAQAAPVPERRQGSAERRAPPPRQAPGLGKAPSRVQRDDGPDFGPGVDWRLSRVNLDDVDAKGPPRRQQRETTAPAAASADIPARLAGRLVLPAADSTRRGAQPASPERTVQRVGGDLRVVLSNQPRSAAAAPAAPTAPARAASGRGHAVTKKAAAADNAVESAAGAPDKPPPKSAEKWRYKDPKGVVRDCTFKELIAWSAAGYFASGVPVQRASDGPAEWMTLGVALKAMAPPPAPKPQAATHHAPPPPDPAPEEVAPVTDCGWGEDAIRAARALFGRDTEWVYTDPEGNEQGPFRGPDMLGWLLDGYMHDHQLPVAQADDGARAFKALEQWLG